MKKLYVFLVGLLCGATFVQAQCTISLTANPNSPVCAGNPVYLNATGANTYVWTPGNLTGNSVTVNPTGTTTYLVTGTDLSSNTCSAYAIVTVNPTPTVTNTPLSQTICPGAHTTLVTLTSNVSGTTFTWTATATSGVTGFTLSGNNTIPVQTISTTATTQGTVTYVITPTATGCAGPTTNYTVLVNPSPSVTNTPLSQTICSGSQTSLVTLTSNVSGANFVYTATATVGVTGWTTSGTNTIPVQTISTTAATQGTVTYVITPTAAGCSGPTTIYTVKVNPNPTITVPASMTVCIGSIVPEATLVPHPGGMGSTFTWWNTLHGTGFASPAGTNTIPAFTATNDTTFPITDTVTVIPALNGCVGIPSTYSITVNPVATVTANVAPTTICSGQSSTLTAATADSYTWMPGSLSGSSVIVTPTANTVYTVSGTLSGYVCTATAAVQVNLYPTVTVPANITACISSLIPQSTITCTPSGSTFIWTCSDPSIGMAASGTTNYPAFTATNSGSSPITATITVTPTNGGCLGTPASYTITVNPVQTVTASYSPNPACLGQNISLSALPSGDTYAWTGPSGYTSTLQNPTITTPTWSSGTFTVSATYSGYTCTNTVTVVMHPHPAVTILPNNPTICPGSCVALTASAGTGITYMWQPGSITSSSMTACPTTNTAYTVIATNSFGCTSSTTTMVTVAPDFVFSVTPSNVTIPAGQCATFHITTAGTYLWSPAFGLNTTVGSTVTACPAATTSYTVMGTNGSGCTGTTLVTVHFTGNYIDDVLGSSPCHLPYLAILNIADDFVQHNDTILYNLNYGDDADTTFTMIYQNEPTPLAAITHAYMAMGSYSPWAILQHTNGLADTIHTQNLIVASDTCGDISGTVFYDNNANCLPDVGEFRISNALIKLYNPLHTLLQAQFTGANGFYSFNVPNGNYTVEIDSLIYNSFGLLCPSGGTYTIASIPATGKNYGVNCTTGFDLYGGMYEDHIVPGNISNIILSIGNLLCNVTNANVKLVLDPRVTFVNSTFIPTSITGDTIWWNVTNLSIADTAQKTIICNVYVSPTAIVNDSLLLNLTVNPISGDANPLNNTLIRKFRIQGSWDPNGKEVTPSGDITKNTDLTYTIHFQNTGNAEAYNIYILDTLDAHLDLSTLEMVAASHPYSVEILNSTQKDVLKFFFPNIMLPDSGSNQMLSNGFVSYKIRPLANCVEGTIITNLADIYFDYNPAVPTNMVQNQIPLILGVNQETIPSTRDRVIPNPVSQQATLTYAVPEQGKTVIKLFDITGKETLSLLHQDLCQGEHHLSFDCKDLKSGIYFIRITTNRSSSVVKLVKL